MTPVPDPIAALVAFLKADPDVAALVGTRVFGGELPASETPSMPRKAIVVRTAGGPGAIGRAYQPYADQRADVISYGETPHAADRVYRAVYGALKQLRRQVVSQCFLHWATKCGGPIPMRDPDTDYPSVFSSWQLLVGEVAVA